MAASPNWARWIFASLAKHFDSKKGSVKMFVEGNDVNTQNESSYFEFRMNGPYLRELSKGYWHINVMVNILVVQKRSENIYDYHTYVGQMVAAFENGIAVYKLGNGADDDPLEVLGCLQLDTDKDNPIQVDHLGQVSPDVKEMQGMVQATYCMYLEV